jgi:hypothetical protein
MGTYKYTIARDNCENCLPHGDPSWEVVINPDRNYPTESVSRVRAVSVFLDDYDLVRAHKLYSFVVLYIQVLPLSL